MLKISQLEQQIADVMGAARIPGLALAIIRGQEPIYAAGFGTTSLEDGGMPVTPQTLFRIGSTTKSLTGTAAMRLVERGELALDQPIREKIGWFELRDPGLAERVTLRMLLAHTAGLPTDWELYNEHDPAALEAFVRRAVPRYPLVGPPGAQFEYSNVGTNIVGFLVELVSALPFAQAMQELLFAPLSMERTTFDPLVAMTYPLAQAHVLADDGALRVHHRFLDHTAHYPAGFAISSVLDMANFAVMHLNNGRFRQQQLLTPEAVASMHAPHGTFSKPAGHGYGLGFMVEEYKGVRLVGHSGSIPYYHSRFYIIPKVDSAVVVLVNCMAGFQSIVELIFDQLLAG